MATATLLTATSSTTDTSTPATGSLSPSGDAVLMWIQATAGSALSDPTVTGLGLTWAKVAGPVSAQSNRTGWWYLGEGTISAPDTIDVDFSGATVTAYQFVPYDLADVDTSDIIVQAVTASDPGSGQSSQSVTLASFDDATNNLCFYGVVTNRGTGGNITQDSPLSDDFDIGLATPTVRSATGHSTGENTSPSSVTDVSCRWGAIGIEVRHLAAGGTDRAGRIHQAYMRVPFEHYSDTFDRSASELGDLEHNSTGTTIAWTDIEDDFAVDGDHAYVPSPTMPGEPTATVPGWFDAQISADIHTSATSNRVNVGLAFRLDAANHYLFVKLENSAGHGAGVLDIMSYGEGGGGGSSILESVACPFTEGDVIHLVVTFQGDEITAECPDLGVTANYTLDSGQLAEFTGTDFGIRSRTVSDEDDGGSEWNNFSARDLTDHVGRIYWAEMELPDASREGRIYWSEMEVDDAPRAGRLFWSEMEVDDAPRLGRIFWAEMELDDAPRAGRVYWAEMELGDDPRAGRIFTAWLSVPDAPRAGQVFWAEMETPDAPRAGRVYWAELQVQDVGGDREGRIFTAWLSVPDAPRAGQVFWAEMELDDAPRAGRVYFAEVEITPDPPRKGRIYWAEFVTMNTSADGKDGWVVWRHSSQPQPSNQRPFRRRPYGTRFGSRP